MPYVDSPASMVDRSRVVWRGLEWDPKIPEHLRHLILWKHWREAPFRRQAKFLSPRSEHFLEACRLLFTPQQLVIHPWFEEMANDYTENSGYIMWGSASSGKSHFMGLAFLLDYITDPTETSIILASTGKEALAQRSFASVVDYLGHLKANGKFHVPFKFVAQKMTVMLEADEESSAKAVIRGVAVEEGSERESRAKLQGVHLPYTRVGADELAGMKPVILSVLDNLGVCKDFKFIGAANPESIYDPCGQASIPEHGWGSIDLDTVTWQTKAGWCVRRFDAFKSPGIKHPTKYPFLPNATTIAAAIAKYNGNEDAPGIWTYQRAMPPPQASERTVLTEAMVRSGNMSESTQWKGSSTMVAGFDPAFSEGGDNPILVTARVGIDVRNKPTLEFVQVHKLLIKASDPTPVLHQLGMQARSILMEAGVRPENVGVDDSGTQSVADYLELLMGAGVYRFSFGAKPPDLPVSAVNPTPAGERYRDKATWAYYLVADYGAWEQIRALPEVAAQQFCARRLLPKQRPLRIEPKADYKKRTKQQSPDEADACAIAVAVARERLNLIPGAMAWQMGAPVLPQAYHRDSSDWVRDVNNLATSYENGVDSWDAGGIVR